MTRFEKIGEAQEKQRTQYQSELQVVILTQQKLSCLWYFIASGGGVGGAGGWWCKLKHDEKQWSSFADISRNFLSSIKSTLGESAMKSLKGWEKKLVRSKTGNGLLGKKTKQNWKGLGISFEVPWKWKETVHVTGSVTETEPEQEDSVEAVENSLCRTSLDGMNGARLRVERLQKYVSTTMRVWTRDSLCQIKQNETKQNKQTNPTKNLCTQNLLDCSWEPIPGSKIHHVMFGFRKLLQPLSAFSAMAAFSLTIHHSLQNDHRNWEQHRNCCAEPARAEYCLYLSNSPETEQGKLRATLP